MATSLTKFERVGVIVGRDVVGDALMKLPFLRAMRRAWPEAKIHWITALGTTSFGTILRAPTAHLIDEINEMPEWLLDPSRPDTPQFDLVLDTRNRWKLALQARRLPHKLFIAMAWRHVLSDRHPNPFKPKGKHLSDRLLDMVELAAGYRPDGTGALPVAPDLLAKAERLLPAGPTYVGIAPGCSDRERTWPRDRFIRIAQSQAAKGRVPVFLLGPMELDWHQAMMAAVPSALFPLQEYDIWGTAQLGLEHTMALDTRLQLLVGNDSGPGHIMAAVDGPMLSLFGRTDPRKTAPRTSRLHVIRAQEFGGWQMDLIPWEVVDARIDEILDVGVKG